jgi:hypothetical protein
VLLRNEFVVSDVSALREVIPAGLSGSCVADATKVIGHLDEQMVGFVRRSPFVQLATVDATGQPFVSLLRRGSRFDSPIAARGERREHALRPATGPMRPSEGSIQVDESSRHERLKRMHTANMLGISERQAARRTTPADTRCHKSAQRAGSTEHTD